MSTVSAVLGASASPITMTVPGPGGKPKTYTFRPVTWTMISQLERWLIDRELTTLANTYKTAAAHGFMTAEDALTKLEAFAHEAANSGKYAYGGPVMTPILGSGGESSMAGLPGKIKVLSIILGCPEDEAVDLMSRHAQEVLTKFQLVMNESMQQPSEDADPKAPTA